MLPWASAASNVYYAATQLHAMAYKPHDTFPSLRLGNVSATDVPECWAPLQCALHLAAAHSLLKQGSRMRLQDVRLHRVGRQVHGIWSLTVKHTAIDFSGVVLQEELEPCSQGSLCRQLAMLAGLVHIQHVTTTTAHCAELVPDATLMQALCCTCGRLSTDLWQSARTQPLA